VTLLDKVLSFVFSHTISTQPGFIIESFGSRKLRNVFLSETAMAGIENAVSKAGGDKLLYQTGKEIGFNYAKAIPLPHFDSPLRGAFLRETVRFLEATLGECTNYSVDWKSKRVEMSFQDFAVCRKNGNGLFFIGAFTGLLAFVFNDKTIEGIQTTCRGRGSSECHGIAMPASAFGKTKFISHANFGETTLPQQYDAFNSIIPFEQEYGLEALGQVGLTKYQTSKFEVLGERFIPLEISFEFGLEKRLKTSGMNLEKTVYTPSFNAFQSFGKQIAEKRRGAASNALDFTAKLLSALGWGLVQVRPDSRPGFIIRGFPWTQDLETLKTSQYFMGAIDGLVSGLSGKKVKSKIVNTSKTEGRLDFATLF